MRKVLSLVIIVSLLVNCKSSIVKTKDIRYLKAYDYLTKIKIYKDSGNYVVDTLYYIPRVFAYSFKTKNKSNNEKMEIINCLKEQDDSQYYKEKYFNFSKKIKKNKNAMFNLYFDKQLSDTINAEIYYNHNDINNPHYIISEFGNSEIYSFIFNKNNEIINVINQTVINN